MVANIAMAECCSGSDLATRVRKFVPSPVDDSVADALHEKDLAMSDSKEESPAQRALAAILEADGPSAKRLKNDPVKAGGLPIHRSKLWMYSTGRGKPSVETAAFIERVTNGDVAANGWETDVVASEEPTAATGTDDAKAEH